MDTRSPSPPPLAIALPSPLAIVLLFVAMHLLQLVVSWLLTGASFWTLVISIQFFSTAPLLAFVYAAWWPACHELFPQKHVRWQTALLLIVITILLSQLTEWVAEWIKHTFAIRPLFEDLYANELRARSLGAALRAIVGVVLLPAILEEYFFRGVCQTSLLQRWNATSAWWLSSILFALAHGHLVFFPLYLLHGLYLGAIRYRTNTLWAPILAHAVNNAWTLWHLSMAS